ncbi:MAG: RnfABCDGE type electron transport complex subunit B [Firmicutes bacterium]|nr:RnfABCDGE type electron transport complex subunit B [Bacillota bacterium]
MQAFIIPIAAAVAIALIAALLLSLAAKFMAVPVNETQAAIRAELPGANCGACGFAGCDDYAAALAEGGDVKTNLCVPGADAVAAAIAAILGQDAEDVIEQVANVRCSGLCDVTKPEMDYQGLKTCAAAKGLFGGPGSCKYGCIGFGDCERACPYGAIQVCNGLAKVDREKCVGCGMCARTCPQHIIDIIPDVKRVYVACSSADKGAVTNKLCSAGCIGCKLCEKACKFDAVHVENNHAVIDIDKCKNCGLCAKACPKKVIKMYPKPQAKPVVKVG